MEKHYDIKTQLRNKFALHMLRVDLPSDFVETTNKYIDEELIPFDENFDGSFIPITFLGPIASTAMAALTAESMPPDKPSIIFLKAFL